MSWVRAIDMDRLLRSTPRPPVPRMLVDVPRQEQVCARVLPRLVRESGCVLLVGLGIVDHAIAVDGLVSVSLEQQTLTFDAGELVEVEAWEPMAR